jgi:hypothetical protein
VGIADDCPAARSQKPATHALWLANTLPENRHGVTCTSSARGELPHRSLEACNDDEPGLAGFTKRREFKPPARLSDPGYRYRRPIQQPNPLPGAQLADPNSQERRIVTVKTDNIAALPFGSRTRARGALGSSDSS